MSGQLALPFRAGFDSDDAAWQANIRELERWAAQSAFVQVVKTTDETRASNTTTTADAELKFAVEPQTKYRVRGKIWFDANTTPDFKYQFTWPASPTHAHLVLNDIVSGGSAATRRLVTDTTQADQTLLSTGNTGGFIEFDMILHNAGTEGVFAFEWAQATSSATGVVVLAGSYLEYQVV